MTHLKVSRGECDDADCGGGQEGGEHVAEEAPPEDKVDLDAADGAVGRLQGVGPVVGDGVALDEVERQVHLAEVVEVAGEELREVAVVALEKIKC